MAKKMFYNSKSIIEHFNLFIIFAQLTHSLDCFLFISSSGLYSGFVYDFIRGVGTLSAVIFLVSFNTPLASIKIINLAEQGDWGEAAALALVLTFITFAILLLGLLTGKIFQKRKLKKGDK